MTRGSRLETLLGLAFGALMIAGAWLTGHVSHREDGARAPRGAAAIGREIAVASVSLPVVQPIEASRARHRASRARAGAAVGGGRPAVAASAVAATRGAEGRETGRGAVHRASAAVRPEGGGRAQRRGQRARRRLDPGDLEPLPGAVRREADRLWPLDESGEWRPEYRAAVPAVPALEDTLLTLVRLLRLEPEQAREVRRSLERHLFAREQFALPPPLAVHTAARTPVSDPEAAERGTPPLPAVGPPLHESLSPLLQPWQRAIFERDLLPWLQRRLDRIAAAATSDPRP